MTAATTTTRQASQPAQDERQALPDALLRGQDQDEGRDREGLKGDREPDEHKIKHHVYRSRGRPIT